MKGIALWLAAMLVSGPSPDAEHAERAGELFEAGRYSESARAFEAAFEASDDPAYLFGMAQALRRAGNCQGAIVALEQFLQSDPPPADVAVSQDVIDACREVLDLQPEPPAEEATEDPVADPPPPEPVADPPPPRPWHRDVAGGVLLGTGVASGAAAAVLYGVAWRDASNGAGPESSFIDRRDRARTLRGAAVGVAAVSVALLTGAVIRYVIVHRRAR